MDSPAKDLPSSLPPSTSAPAPSAVDVSAHHSCTRCARRMSCIKYDRHSLCLHCRDVQCSLEVRCFECSCWSSDIMQEYIKHRKTLVSKGKKKPVSTAPSSPLVPPAVSTRASVVSSPSLPSLSDDDKLRDYVHSVLSSFLSQSGSVGIDQFSFPAPTVVPDSAPPVRGATRGLWADILNRGRLTEPSGMVSPTQEENPPIMCPCMMLIMIGLG